MALWLYYRYSEAFTLGNKEDGKNKRIRGQGRNKENWYMVSQREALHPLWGRMDIRTLREWAHLVPDVRESHDLGIAFKVVSILALGSIFGLKT